MEHISELRRSLNEHFKRSGSSLTLYSSLKASKVICVDTSKNLQTEYTMFSFQIFIIN